MKELLATLGAMVLGSALATGQCFVPNGGTLQGQGDDGPLLPVTALGFAFPFAGSTWTHLQVSHNGVLFLSRGGASGGTTTGYSDQPASLVATLRGGPGQPPRIAPFWKDLQNLASNGGGVFVDTAVAGRCTVTWRNTVEWGTQERKTVQCLLFADGTVRCHYDANCRLLGGALLVGLAPGHGAADPGPAELSPAPATTGGTSYQTFTAAARDFDLAGRTVEWRPDGQGGYRVTSTVCSPASHTEFSSGCGGLGRAAFYSTAAPWFAQASFGAGLSLRLASGGYTAVALATAFLPPSAHAVVLPLGDEGELAVPLPVPLPRPGGAVTQVFVGSNGWLGFGPLAGLQPGAFLPNVSGWLAAPAAAFALWHDFDPTAMGGGRVLAETRGNRFVVTWDGVWDYAGAGPAAASTFQFQCDLGTGDLHLAIAGLSLQGGSQYLLGYTPGGPALDPGPLDLALDLPRSLLPDLPPLTLTVAPNPVLGRTIVYTTAHIPAGAALALQIVSCVPLQPGIDLGPFGAPGCWQAVDLTGATLIPLLRAGSDQYAIAVPNAPHLCGFVVGSQSAAFAPGRNALGVVTSNAVRSVFNLF